MITRDVTFDKMDFNFRKDSKTIVIHNREDHDTGSIISEEFYQEPQVAH